MDDFIAARLQMAISQGFHIIFACIGMAMPVLMAYSEWKWLRTGKQVYLDVTKAWSKGVAIFFAGIAALYYTRHKPRLFVARSINQEMETKATKIVSLTLTKDIILKEKS